MPDTTPTRDHTVKAETPAERTEEKISDLPAKPLADGDAESVKGGAVDTFIWFDKATPSPKPVGETTN